VRDEVWRKYDHMGSRKEESYTISVTYNLFSMNQKQFCGT